VTEIEIQRASKISAADTTNHLIIEPHCLGLTLSSSVMAPKWSLLINLVSERRSSPNRGVTSGFQAESPLALLV
jgi:hypothetical protein